MDGCFLFTGAWGIGLVALCSPAPVQPLPALGRNGRIRLTYCLLQLTFVCSSVFMDRIWRGERSGYVVTRSCFYFCQSFLLTSLSNNLHLTSRQFVAERRGPDENWHLKVRGHGPQFKKDELWYLDGLQWQKCHSSQLQVKPHQTWTAGWSESLTFCCHIWTVGSELDVKMKAWIHPALYERLRQLVV